MSRSWSGEGGSDEEVQPSPWGCLEMFTLAFWERCTFRGTALTNVFLTNQKPYS